MGVMDTAAKKLARDYKRMHNTLLKIRSPPQPDPSLAKPLFERGKKKEPAKHKRN
jgi:hypothetical protein